MAAPIGNKNATKTKRWTQAIDKALKQYNEGDVERGQALDKIANRLVKQALLGDSNDFKVAMQEIGDRIEGKAGQSMELSVGIDGLPTDDLFKLFVDLNNATSSD